MESFFKTLENHTETAVGVFLAICWIIYIIKDKD